MNTKAIAEISAANFSAAISAHRASLSQRPTPAGPRKRAFQPRPWRQHDAWSEITPERLAVLVWTFSTTDIASQYGISDVAIGKKCRELGVTKPGRGFWAKVQAGKLPHPNGVPQTPTQDC